MEETGPTPRPSPRASPEPLTLLALLARAAEYFSAQGIDEARLQAEMLLAHVLGIQRLDLYLQFDRPLTAAEREAFRGLVRRRLGGEPLQYIVGETDFMDLRLRVNPSVLIPRPETEFLVELALEAAAMRPAGELSVLDIGTGSGCIALAIARKIPAAKVLAIDISEDALSVARFNAVRLGIATVDFQRRDILAPWTPQRTFDLILANPPYVSGGEFEQIQREIREHEPRVAVTDDGDGLLFIRRIVELAPGLLSPGGELFMEIGYGQGKAVEELIGRSGLETRRIHPDFAGIARVVRAVRASGGS